MDTGQICSHICLNKEQRWRKVVFSFPALSKLLFSKICESPAETVHASGELMLIYVSNLRGWRIPIIIWKKKIGNAFVNKYVATDLVTCWSSNEERGTEHAEGITCCLGYGGEEGGVEESMITFLGQVRERSLFLGFF